MKIDIYIFFTLLGLSHSIFLAILFRSKKNRTTYNHIFSLFLIVVSIRISKDILLYLLRVDPNFGLTASLWIFVENIGFAHQFAIGPLLYLYFKYILNQDLKFKRSELIHFSPYALLICLSTYIEWSFWQNAGLHISYLHLFLYYLSSAKEFRRHANQAKLKKNSQLYKWLKYMLLLLAILMLTYMPTMFHYIGYIAGGVVYAIAIFLMTIHLFRDNKLLLSQKYKTSSLTEERRKKIRLELIHLFDKEMVFLDPELSLKNLSEQLAVSTTHLSQIINEDFNKNFSDFTNSYRIDYVKKLFEQDKYKNYKIASLAFESGFDSVSSFNSLFKKYTGFTPSQYKQNHL